MLHLAAQKDQVPTFIYFRDRIKLNSKDNKGSTALHWASFSGS
jgi:ankyrin repeat protein